MSPSQKKALMTLALVVGGVIASRYVDRLAAKVGLGMIVDGSIVS